MRREPAVAAEQKADEFIRAYRDEIGRGQPPAQAGEHSAALGAEGSRIVGAGGLPIRIRDRPHDDAGRRGRARALSFAADQPLESPRVFETEPAIGLAAVWLRIEGRYGPSRRKLPRSLLHQPPSKA